MKTALTIAGSDSSGGAGIQADLKTFTSLGVYGMSVITAVTAQNTCKVSSIQEIRGENVKAQLEAVFTDIKPDSVKIGMTYSCELIEIIAQALENYNAGNIILDPVMVATSGRKLLNEDAIFFLQKRLFPLAELVTPNIPEAEVITNKLITDKKDMENAARKIFTGFGCKVLLKGGHRDEDSSDFFFDGNNGIWFTDEKIQNPNTHGSGCTLSSAIAANLALGKDLESSIRNAKEYITGAIKANLKLGKGQGPLNHMWKIN